MTGRERFNAVINFQETDRPWRMETIGFWNETLERWLGEGLPRAAAAHQFAPYLYFQFDLFIPFPISAHDDIGFYPRFSKKTLRREGEYKIIRDHTGATMKVFTSGASSIPEFIDFPVKSMDDFIEIKKRLDPKTPARIDNPINNLAAATAAVMQWPLGVQYTGLFGLARHLLGFENLMAAYYEDPELLHAIGEHWVRFCKGVTERLARKGDLCFALFWEDMCYRAGPMISPAAFREFMSPYYKEVIDHAKNLGLTSFWVDTDGDCTLLIPLFIEAGVNVLLPFEVQAGMDIRKVRADHGRDLVIFGGLNKLTLAGTREDIEREVWEKAPEMLRSGGWFPAIDHTVQPEVPLANFKFFLRLIRKKVPRRLRD